MAFWIWIEASSWPKVLTKSLGLTRSQSQQSLIMFIIGMITSFHDMVHEEIEVYVDDMIVKLRRIITSNIFKGSLIACTSIISSSTPLSAHSGYLQENSWVSSLAEEELRSTPPRSSHTRNASPQKGVVSTLISWKNQLYQQVYRSDDPHL